MRRRALIIGCLGVIFSASVNDLLYWETNPWVLRNLAIAHAHGKIFVGNCKMNIETNYQVLCAGGGSQVRACMTRLIESHPAASCGD